MVRQLITLKEPKERYRRRNKHNEQRKIKKLLRKLRKLERLSLISGYVLRIFIYILMLSVTWKKVTARLLSSPSSNALLLRSMTYDAQNVDALRLLAVEAARDV